MSAANEPLLVACLCAAWCRTCDEYRPVFDTLRAEFAGRTRFVWVDIEDDEDALGDVDVENFPTLLAARGDRVLFFGTVLPHVQTARGLIERALRDELPRVVADAALAGLPGRIAALPSRD
jgi:thioredoxin-like negative regulator of GroEL